MSGELLAFLYTVFAEIFSWAAGLLLAFMMALILIDHIVDEFSGGDTS